MASRKPEQHENGKDKYVTLQLLYEKLEAITAQNRSEHQEIRLEISKGLSDVKDTTYELNERLVKIEASPAHEKFQTNFCPNTKGITDIGNWIQEHKEVHKALMDQLQRCEGKIDNFVNIIREDRTDFTKERMQLQLDGMKRMKWAIIGIVCASAGSVLTAIILTTIGIG